MNLRSFLDRYFPYFAKHYRRYRDNRAYARLLSQPHKSPNGLTIYGDSGLFSSRNDSGETKFFLQYLSNVDLVIDVGANVGLFTCIAAQNNKKVISIEPNPDNLFLLYKNLEENTLQAEVLPIAIADTVSIMPLYGGGQGSSLHSGWGGMQNTYHQQVPVNTLDNLFVHRIANSSVLIKIDVEGYEYFVLKGSNEILNRESTTIWIIENGFRENFEDINPHFQAVFDIFWEHDYACYTIGQDLQKVTRSHVKQWIEDGQRSFGSVNYLFIKNTNSLSNHTAD